MICLSPPSLEAIPEDSAFTPPSTPPLTPLRTPPDEEPMNSHADLEVVASDGARLLTSCELLRSASSSFLIMKQWHDVGTLSTIHFKDPFIECSATITLFLHLISSRTLPTPSTASFCHYENLLLFLKRYKCHHHLAEKIARCVQGWMEDGYVTASKAFRVGSLVGDDRLCKAAVEAGNEWTWAGESRASLSPPSEHSKRHHQPPGPNIHDDGIPGAPALDITAMPFSFFKSLPDEYKFALMRATRNVAGPSVALDKTNWDGIAREFEKVLGEVKKTPGRL
ncbi:hypothetical protein B9479_001197 [Cryptococcus floricola]|uniref:BTB domain-containing protein n=1 Tax=Cryptococcus floricola TaxID=2591691 RepID=A0A5D3B6A2_9TREE|nr:hypothetical protein B9479_001197 [Cryptococcus floricola]